MELPRSMRESLVEELDEFLESFSTYDPETVTNFVIEALELYADDHDLDDLIGDLEESGALETSLAEILESEMNENEEFEYTGEEIVSLLERLCDIEFGDDVDVDDDVLDDEEEEEEEEEL